MATKQSIAARAKKAENRVAHYFWGDGKYRDWAANHDIEGILYEGDDADGNSYVCEVKNYQFPSGAASLWSLMLKALEQAEGYNERAFAVLIPVRASVPDALVMFRVNSMPVITTAALFKEKLSHTPIKENNNEDNPDDPYAVLADFDPCI